MIKLLLTTLYLSSLTLQTCSTGCLKCSTTVDENGQSTCLLCDQTSGFYLDNQTCKLAVDAACIQWGLQGNCLLCQSNYFFDPQQNKCAPVPTQSVIENCQYYLSDLNCRNCQQGFLIEQNACVKIETPIANCASQLIASECSECQKNFYRTPDFKQCKNVPLQQHCLSYSDIECQKCKTGYIYDKNVYQRQLLQDLSSTGLEKIIDHIEADKEGFGLFDNSIKKCELIQVTNCLVYSRFDQCKTCQSNYYLDSKFQCVKNPNEKIENCAVYNSLTNCQSCSQGYFRKNQQLCQKIKPEEFIQNCSSYSTTQSSIQCTKCETDYYLKDNLCVERQNIPLSQCSIYNNTQDSCQQCNTGYVLSSDNLQCLLQIQNCKEYQPFTSGSKQADLVCIKCSSQLYLQNNQCIQGTQPNCEEYKTSANQCSKCLNEFWSIPECYNQTSISQCVDYSKEEWNVCTKCNTETINLRVKSKCELLPEIANCQTYYSNSSLKKNLCQACQSGFYRDNSMIDNQCLGIQTGNCETAQDDTGKCLTCQTGFGLAENKKEVKCQTPYEALLSNCHENGIVQSNDNFNNFQCQICKNEKVPFVYQPDLFPVYCINSSILNFLPAYFQNYKTFRNITNCVKYQDSDSAYPLCFQCADGYFVSQDQKSCVANQCRGNSTDQKSFYSIRMLNPDNNLPGQNYLLRNQCTTDSNTWSVFGFYLSNQSNGGLACKIDMKIVDLSESRYSNINAKNVEKDWVEHFLDIFPRVSCISSGTSVSINGGVSTPIQSIALPQCEYYQDLGGSNYSCLRCPFGQRFSATPALTNAYISTCEAMIECSSETEYKNIALYWVKLFSCHKCNDTAQIPVLAYNGISTTDPQFSSFPKFSLSNHNWTATNTSLSNQIFCMNVTDRNAIISKLSLGTTYQTGNANAAKLVTLSNCSLAVLNLQYSNQFDNQSAVTANDTIVAFSGAAETALLCAQCKPGFENIYYTGTGDAKFASFCRQITGCDLNVEQKWFNACSQCEAGKTYAYEGNTVKWNKCVVFPSTRVEYQNCLAWEITNANEGSCKVCKKGYHLNPQNHHCEQIVVPTCSEFNIENSNIQINNNPELYLYLYQKGFGCISCNSGMINYYRKGSNHFYKRTICVESNLVTPTTNFQNLTFYQPATTNYQASYYVNFCIRYKMLRNAGDHTDFNGQTCDACKEGYLLRNQGKKCELQTFSANCLLLHETNNDCMKCNTGYALQKNASGVTVCVKGNIEFCLEYYTETLFSGIRCKTCQNSFFYKDGKCVQGLIPNCISFTSEYVCTACSENYWLVGAANNLNVVTQGFYCLRKDESMNCQNAYFTGGDFHCAQCQKGSQKLVQIEHGQSALQNEKILRTKCFTYQPIANCKVHNKQFSLTQKSLFCEECAQEYYVQNNGYFCKQRQNIQNNCETYVKDEDKCLSCKTDNFLNSTTNVCTPNPIGQVGCRNYSIEAGVLKCLSCGVDQYLGTTQCEPITLENKIPQCQYYKSATECSQCYSGFYLEQNECLNITVENCIEYITHASCAVCKQGFRLLDQGNNTICQLFEKPNCQQYDQLTLQCLVCNENYHIDSNGNCVEVLPENLILNCVQYRKDQLCSKCAENFVLSADFKECGTKGSFDSNCIQQRRINTWDCNVCATGFQFVGEICQRIDDSIQGCFIRDVNNSNKCAVCQSGFYMEKGQNCAKNI